MRREENWAIEESRIRDFLAAQPEISETAEGFVFGQCQIRLIPVSGQLFGKWPQQRTIVIMGGSEEDTSRIYQRFFLRFSENRRVGCRFGVEIRFPTLKE